MRAYPAAVWVSQAIELPLQTTPERYRKTAVYLTVGEGATGRGWPRASPQAKHLRRCVGRSFDLFLRFLVDLETASTCDLLGRHRHGDLEYPIAEGGLGLVRHRAFGKCDNPAEAA